MTDEALTQEIESLRAHNAELLADVRKHKAKALELAGQVESLAAERDGALAQVKAVTLDAPVRQMAERVALDADLFTTLFARHYTFAHDGESVVIHDSEGNPATLKDDKGKLRPALFTENDIRALCDQTDAKASFDRLVIASRASGGGAPGSRYGSPTPADKPKDAGQQPAPAFGFR